MRVLIDAERLEDGAGDGTGDRQHREHHADRARNLGEMRQSASKEIGALRCLADQRFVDGLGAGDRFLTVLSAASPIPVSLTVAMASSLALPAKAFATSSSSPSIRSSVQFSNVSWAERGAGDNGIDFLIEARIIRERFQKTIRRGAQGERVRALQSANQRQGDGRVRVGQQFQNRGNVGREDRRWRSTGRDGLSWKPR